MTNIEITLDAVRYEWSCPSPKCDLTIICDKENVVWGLAKLHQEAEHLWDEEPPL